MKTKPKILFFADYPNWAFHHIYRSISLRLRNKFDFDIYFSSLRKQKLFKQKLLIKYDIIWITYPLDKTYLQLKYKPGFIIKEVASWRWQNTYKATEEFIQMELNDADIIVCPSFALFQHLCEFTNNVAYIPNGVESWFFKNKNRKIKSKEKLTEEYHKNILALFKGKILCSKKYFKPKPSNSWNNLDSEKQLIIKEKIIESFDMISVEVEEIFKSIEFQIFDF